MMNSYVCVDPERSIRGGGPAVLFELRHVIPNTMHFVDSDEPVQPPLKLKNSKCCSVSSLTVIEYSSD